MKRPQIIQGGMGAGVSDWRLARAVSSKGQMGVVSGTALDLILARRLQIGDPGGHMRRGLEAFPDSEISRHILDRYFNPNGKPSDRPFIGKPMAGHTRNRHLDELLLAANFVEVFLAKEGHDGTVGINFLNKIQSPLLPSLYGAMLAGVDVVLVGAGIPLEIPPILDSFSRGEPAELKLHVQKTASGREHKVSFNPNEILANAPAFLQRPLFFPIVSSASLAALLIRRCKGQVDGLIVERPSAGGHNAPPRGHGKLSSDGEPLYGPRDVVDLEAISSHGLPFWLAGSCGTPEELMRARDAGAVGVQVGTLFAFCEDSGLREDLKRNVIERCRRELPRVFTDPVASPTGFPFKVLSVSGTLSDSAVYRKRHRQCDLGYLREPFEKSDGTIGWRCPAEEPETYARKGGNPRDSVGRKCLCNALAANIGLGQIRVSGEGRPLLT